MGEYDAVWVFIFSAIFVGFYIFIEARPKGSTFLKECKKPDLMFHEVSKDVNKPTNNTTSLIQAV